MKQTLLFTLLMLGLNVYAPENRGLYVLRAYAVNIYEPLIRAVVMVESNGDLWALNVKEQATGAFQIRPVRLAHFNKLTGKRYVMPDMFNYTKAREVFLYFAVWYDRDFEVIARNWNGSGSMTDDYWNRVKDKL